MAISSAGLTVGESEASALPCDRVGHDVRTLRIGHREFESMLRERPDVALAAIRILAGRHAELTTDEGSA